MGAQGSRSIALGTYAPAHDLCGKRRAAGPGLLAPSKGSGARIVLPCEATVTASPRAPISASLRSPTISRPRLATKERGCCMVARSALALLVIKVRRLRLRPHAGPCDGCFHHSVAGGSNGGQARRIGKMESSFLSLRRDPVTQRPSLLH